MADPTDLTYSRADKVLRVAYDDGAVYDLPASLLRVESPSAEVQGHGKGQKTVPQGKDNVGITAIEPVGHYAVRITFDDGHDTGLFTYRYLRDLGEGKRLP